MTTPATEQWIDDLVAAISGPLEKVGVLLAKEIDRLDAEVTELQQHVNGLQERVRELEKS
jgi:hypothetical protein